jgi:transcriptional regulator
VEILFVRGIPRKTFSTVVENPTKRTTMYTPVRFQESDPQTLFAFMQEHSFAALTSLHQGQLFTTHLPFLLQQRGDQLMLIGHMARANPQWKSFLAQEVLVIFAGPHCYISPTWYKAAPHVPTWNYTAVHAYGTPSLIEDPEAVHAVLRDLVEHFEASEATPWLMELPEDFRQNLQAAIVAFEIPVSRLQGKFKLSQNRTSSERAGVIAALSQKTSDNERGVYQLMTLKE